MGRVQLGLELAEGEVGAIAEFLASLTGEQPRIVYPVLPVVTSNTPLPKPYDNP
jgi:cytochrome c peroxidase